MKRFLAIFLCLVMLMSSFSLVLAEGTEPGGSENETQPEPWAPSFAVTFVDWDDTVLKTERVVQGEDATAPDAPTRDADETYTYEFAGWDTDFTNVQADITVKATYTQTEKPKSFSVKFVDEDGTELYAVDVLEGETPAYKGAEPTKAADAQYTYTFAGWSPEIVAATEDATYTATYEATVNKYTVKFVNHDGSELQSEELEYGATPVYNGATPTKAEDETYTYTFDTWTPEIATVTGEATYTATFTETAKPTEPDDDVVPGDALGDGSVDIFDALNMVEKIVNNYTLDMVDARVFDYKEDGKFDIFDVLALIETIVNS